MYCTCTVAIQSLYNFTCIQICGKGPPLYSYPMILSILINDLPNNFVIKPDFPTRLGLGSSGVVALQQFLLSLSESTSHAVITVHIFKPLPHMIFAVACAVFGFGIFQLSENFSDSGSWQDSE